MRPLGKTFIEKYIERVTGMVNYEKLYSVLFNGITDAIRNIEQQNYGFARCTLIEAQQRAENIFIESGDE